uniref:Uncharacterized protein n=1 Tax=Rousettus aegyptiacus TaxID=9407 RepID=A0A7J8DXT0_ROUAE|nr:hypothetical protein HJG63_008317 [Rousettus aegyptiacus]
MACTLTKIKSDLKSQNPMSTDFFFIYCTSKKKNNNNNLELAPKKVNHRDFVQNQVRQLHIGVFFYLDVLITLKFGLCRHQQPISQHLYLSHIFLVLVIISLPLFPDLLGVSEPSWWSDRVHTSFIRLASSDDRPLTHKSANGALKTKAIW